MAYSARHTKRKLKPRKQTKKRTAIKSKRSVSKLRRVLKFYLPFGILLILAVIAGLYTWKHTKIITTTSATSFQSAVTYVRPVEKPTTPFPLTTLLFEQLPTAANKQSMLSLTDSSGTVIKKISSYSTQPTYTSVVTPQNGNLTNNSAALLSNLISSPDNITYSNRWDLIGANGTVSYVPYQLEAQLNAIIPSDASPYLFGKNSLLVNAPGQANPESTVTTLLLDNLTSGTQTTVLRVNSKHAYGTYFYPQYLNPSGTELSILVKDVVINSQSINGPAVVVLNLSNEQIVVHLLPIKFGSLFPARAAFNSTSNPGLPSMWVSADGSLCAYLANKGQIELYDVSQNKTINIADTQATVGSGTQPIFSADNNYFVTTYQNAENTILSIFRTTDGHLVKKYTARTIDGPLVPDGWIGYDTLVLTTPSGTQSYDILANTTHTYSPALGTLSAVLNEN